MRELDYGDDGAVSPTTRWIGGLVLQIFTTITSANSTFSVLIDKMHLEQTMV